MGVDKTPPHPPPSQTSISEHHERRHHHILHQPKLKRPIRQQALIIPPLSCLFCLILFLPSTPRNYDLDILSKSAPTEHGTSRWQSLEGDLIGPIVNLNLDILSTVGPLWRHLAPVISPGKTQAPAHFVNQLYFLFLPHSPLTLMRPPGSDNTTTINRITTTINFYEGEGKEENRRGEGLLLHPRLIFFNLTRLSLHEYENHSKGSVSLHYGQFVLANRISVMRRNTHENA